jgi:glycosyltransferase involved in cell wall biosynthesis
VLAQARQPDEVIIVNDRDRRGAGWARQRVLDRVQTDWLAWLDSDDEWLPEHLGKLLRVADATGAVFVYSWFETPGGMDHLGHFGLPFNPATPHHTTTTYLVRTEFARRVGYRIGLADGRCNNEDWHHILGLSQIAADEGLGMVHLAERTWRYHMDGLNSSGKPGQGDAQ